MHIYSGAYKCLNKSEGVSEMRKLFDIWDFTKRFDYKALSSLFHFWKQSILGVSTLSILILAAYRSHLMDLVKNEGEK